MSIYYDIRFNKDGSPKLCMDETSFLTNMYYTVRLSKKRSSSTFQGKATKICLADLATQAAIIRIFLESLAIPYFFENGFKSWKFKSIDDAFFNTSQSDSFGFVADIEVVVKK